MPLISSYEEFTKKESAFVIKTERDYDVAPKIFPNGKYLNFFIRIFLDIEKEKSYGDIYSFSDINFVRYQLHPSYIEPLRISEDSLNNFEIKVWAYGYYSVQASVFPKRGPVINLNGFVRFPVRAEDRLLDNLENLKPIR